MDFSNFLFVAHFSSLKGIGIGNPTAHVAVAGRTLPSLGGAWQAPRASRRGGTGMRSPSRRGPSGREGWFAGAWVQGGARRWRVPTTEGGYHCTCWSKTYSGDGCARASQSGTASTGGSSQAGGPRAGLIRGGSAGSPMWVRIRAHRGGLGDEGDDAHVGAAVRADQGQGREWTLHRWRPETTGRQSKPGVVGFAVFCCRSATGLLCPLRVVSTRPGSAPWVTAMRVERSPAKDH